MSDKVKRIEGANVDFISMTGTRDPRLRLRARGNEFQVGNTSMQRMGWVREPVLLVWREIPPSLIALAVVWPSLTFID